MNFLKSVFIGWLFSCQTTQRKERTSLTVTDLLLCGLHVLSNLNFTITMWNKYCNTKGHSGPQAAGWGDLRHLRRLAWDNRGPLSRTPGGVMWWARSVRGQTGQLRGPTENLGWVSRSAAPRSSRGECLSLTLDLVLTPAPPMASLCLWVITRNHSSPIFSNCSSTWPGSNGINLYQTRKKAP